ncbi:alpha/beta fold hydrolase [Baekduia sp. Peel2402]|uniref:alpha/beta fold hydrolase n=1 Tax=Baekduia sp. Peel2402 TaxID=3458296 RepID=UPI00403E8A24
MLYVERSGEGAPVVLLHGLTATHKYVVMGSKSLQRAGHDVVAYDARGHGASDPAPTSDAYTYEDLAKDLLWVMDQAGFDRAVLAGASMGAHTSIRFALDHPERVAGLVVITPAYDPEAWPGNLARWDALSDGLRSGGVEGFVEAYGDEGPEKWKDTLKTVLRQRLSAHEHQDAVADALRAVPRSRPFAARADLERIAAPTVVVADRDEPDPGHPLAVGELYASLIPGARLVVEDEGSSPIAWQGGQLSKVIASVVAEAGLSAE